MANYQARIQHLSEQAFYTTIDIEELQQTDQLIAQCGQDSSETALCDHYRNKAQGMRKELAEQQIVIHPQIDEEILLVTKREKPWLQFGGWTEVRPLSPYAWNLVGLFFQEFGYHHTLEQRVLGSWDIVRLLNLEENAFNVPPISRRDPHPDHPYEQAMCDLLDRRILEQVEGFSERFRLAIDQ